MPTKKKPVTKLSPKQKLVAIIKTPFFAIKKRTSDYLTRRPHRSFRRTRRRDYVRSLKLPGYWAFTSYVRKTLWTHRKTFLLLALVYAVFTALMVGFASQENYTTLTDTLREAGDDIFSGNWGGVEKAGLLLSSILSGAITPELSDLQRVYAIIIAFLTWLTTVWLLRNILAGHKVKLRDGLYNSTAPLVSTLLVASILFLQLLPLVIALVGYAAASASGLLSGGVEAMLFWVAAGLLTVLSLYWITSTFIALVIVTLPGMYPLKALETAGDVVVGRRIRILLRILWLVLGLAVTWTITMILIILFDTWLKGLWPAIEWIPIIPVAILILGSLTVIWAASYIYLLYRRIVADDTAPA